jgi:hypothetical protein
MLTAATFGYWILTVPILLLGTAVCFTHLPDPTHQFGRVRLWGTVGWMVQGWIVLAIRLCLPEWSLADCTQTLFRLGSVLCFALSGYALTLPATPPQTSRSGRPAPLAALALLKSRPFFVYCACLFGLYLTFPFMTQGVPLLLKRQGVSEFWLGPTLSLAQGSEVIALALLPVSLLRCGVRGTMLVGLSAWAAAFGLLALGGPVEMTAGAPVLNGLCISGFFVAGQVFVNRRATADVRASAQALLAFVGGVGLLLGNVVVGVLRNSLGSELSSTFGVGSVLTGAMLLLFLVGFRERSPIEQQKQTTRRSRPHLRREAEMVTGQECA